MGLMEKIDTEFVTAMKARQKDTVDVLRMIKSRISERRTAPGFTGELDDALVQEVVSSYCKGLSKAIEEIVGAGAGDNPIIGKYRWEIDYLQAYLPSLLDASATREIVKGVIASLGVSGPKAVGRVMGTVMKEHKGEVDAAIVRQVAEECLAE